MKKIQKLRKFLRVTEQAIREINSDLKAYMPAFKPALSDLEIKVRAELKERRERLEAFKRSIESEIEMTEITG